MTSESKAVEPQLNADDAMSPWYARSNCRGEDNRLFFTGYEGAGKPAEPEKALGLCAVCDVRPECLQYALETNQEYGVWGGYEEDERRRLRKRWLAERRRYAARESSPQESN